MQQIGQFVPGFSHQACKDRDDWVHKQARKDLGLPSEQEDLPRLSITIQ